MRPVARPLLASGRSTELDELGRGWNAGGVEHEQHVVTRRGDIGVRRRLEIQLAASYTNQRQADQTLLMWRTPQGPTDAGTLGPPCAKSTRPLAPAGPRP